MRDLPKNIKNELEFRLWFKDTFNIDYIQATHNLNEQKKETARVWNNLLMKHNIKILI